MFSGKTRVIPVTRTSYKNRISEIIPLFGKKLSGNKYYRFSLITLQEPKIPGTVASWISEHHQMVEWSNSCDRPERF
jgi:hypothetical protein